MGRTCVKDHRPEHSLGDERWAYSKLHHMSYSKPDDALMMDRMKLLLEHGIGA